MKSNKSMDDSAASSTKSKLVVVYCWRTVNMGSDHFATDIRELARLPLPNLITSPSYSFHQAPSIIASITILRAEEEEEVSFIV
ncbi:hypothetical protein TcWFU_007524 [Taenia crassiceps]|uniref:Uncharacterized protein n=1 Tax=Taenia crassiceps TaxID=6207 RepID=A0ABR4QSX8_9CEST